MNANPVTVFWFARHEWRLASRDWIAMMSGGRRKRLGRVLAAIVGFVVFMHFIAYGMVGRYAAAAPDQATLLAISATVLMSWLLMISQAMESTTRAFYARSDLDLILSSPVAAEKLFAVRMATVAVSMTMMALPLAAPFIDVLIARGGWRWTGAYGVIVAMGATATALAIALSVALFRLVGAKRARFVAQVVAAMIGAAFVIGLQIAAILSYGSLSRSVMLRSQALLGDLPGPGNIVWWPARAALGDGMVLLAVLGLAFILLVSAIAVVAPRFAAYTIASADVGALAFVQTQSSRAFRTISPQQALRRKEWILLRRDPWLVSQTLMQMLYLIPPAVLLWRSFAEGNRGAYQLLVPVLVMAAGQLAGGLAWLAISGEDAPDLVASAPMPARSVIQAKIEAVLGIIAVIFAPLVAGLAAASLRYALITSAGIIVAAVAATSIQLWFRSQAKRSQFRRRQVSSRLATFAEAFSSIGWAATSAVAVVSVVLAVVPGLLATIIVAGAWLMSPGQSARPGHV